jgi:hypothetical protein
MLLTWFTLSVVCAALPSPGDAERARLRYLAAEIVARQDAIARAIRTRSRDYPPHYDQGRTEPAIRDLPLVVLEKGKSVKVRQGISWRQYGLDTLKVTLVSSSPELVVPAELTLDFERHSLDSSTRFAGWRSGTTRWF